MTAAKPDERASRRPVDAKTRARIEAMARTGQHSRNAVAREFGVSPSTVSRICREATPPITFDRSATSAAVEAHARDLKAQRATLAQDVLDEARAVLAKFQQQHVKIGWYQGMASEHIMDGPESGDVKNYAIALGVLVDKHLVLVREDSDDRDLPAVEVFLRGQGVPSLFGG